MKLVGAGWQQRFDPLLDASGKITTGGTPQLLLPRHLSRSMFMFVNNSSDTMYIDFGCGYAHATLTSGVVTSVTVDNAGFGFTKPPLVQFVGGGQPQGLVNAGPYPGVSAGIGTNTSFVGCAAPGYPAPSDPALAHATLSGGAITSIVVDHGGSNYVVAPYVFLAPSDLDPNGAVLCGITYLSSIPVSAGGSLQFLGTTCPTDACSVVGAATNSSFLCKFMT